MSAELLMVAVLFSQVAAIQSVAEQSLDYGLAADVQHRSFPVQLTQHRSGEINIHAPDDGKVVCEVSGNILSTISHFCNSFRIDWLRCFRHTVSFPLWLRATSDQVIELASAVRANLVDHAIQLARYPPDSAPLFGSITTTVENVVAVEQHLYFLKANAALRICPQSRAFYGIKAKAYV